MSSLFTDIEITFNTYLCAVDQSLLTWEHICGCMKAFDFTLDGYASRNNVWACC